MRYCGNCGASFEPDALRGRMCPSCGALINQTGDLQPDALSHISQEPTLQPPRPLDDEALSALPTRPNLGDPTTLIRARRLPKRLVTLLALLALAVTLVGGSALLLGNNAVQRRLGLPPVSFGSNPGGSQATITLPASHGGSGSQPSPNGGAPSTPAASPVGSSTPGTPTTATATPLTTATVINSTPTAISSGTSTPLPAQPVLTVAPLHISLSVCVSASTQFTVANTGGGTLEWSASTSSSLYNVAPQGGFLSGGQQQVVTASNITLGGNVTVAASGAATAPQTVTITCGV